MKKLYKQFNNLKVDENIQAMSVSESEIERVKKTVMKHKNKGSAFRNVSAAAILFIASSITLGVAYPAFASQIPFIGNIFLLFDDESEQFKDYEVFSSGLDITKESNGISITLANAVYDGEAVTISYMIESESDLGESPTLPGSFVIEGYDGFQSERSLIEKVGDHQYAGVSVGNLVEGNNLESINVSWKPESIHIDKEISDQSITGEWPFQFTLNAIDNEVEAVDIKTEEKGITLNVSKMTQTSISTVFYYTHKADSSIQEKWEHVLLNMTVIDNFGNEYKVIDDVGYGESAYSMDWKFTTSAIPEEVTSITLIPEISVFNDSDLDLKTFTIKHIEIPF